MKPQKKKTDKTAEEGETVTGELTTRQELKAFLLSIRDRLEDEAAAPVYAVSALNHVMNSSRIYALMDNENREVARDIWLRLRKRGSQLKNPPILFAQDEEQVAG